MAAFEGRDFLLAATFLATQAGDEGSVRSAISRAYYACFHRARDYVRTRSTVVRADGSAHVAVRRHIGAVDGSIEWDLLRLHTLRKHADYDIPFPDGDPLAAAQLAIDLAARIIAMIDALEGKHALMSHEE